MILRSENHLNFYQYAFNTTSPSKVKKAMKRYRSTYRRFSSGSSKGRRHSLPDLSDESWLSYFPTTESSPARSLRTDTLSSEPKSLRFDESRRGSRRQSDPTTSAITENNTTKVDLTVDLPKTPANNPRQSALRRKSKSIESIAVEPLSEQTQSNQGNSNDDEENKQNKKNNGSKTKNRIKAFFSVLRNPNRNFWSSARPVLSSSTRTSGTLTDTASLVTSQHSAPKSVKQRVAEQSTRLVQSTEPKPSTSRQYTENRSEAQQCSGQRREYSKQTKQNGSEVRSKSSLNAGHQSAKLNKPDKSRLEEQPLLWNESESKQQRFEIEHRTQSNYNNTIKLSTLQNRDDYRLERERNDHFEIKAIVQHPTDRQSFGKTQRRLSRKDIHENAKLNAIKKQLSQQKGEKNLEQFRSEQIKYEQNAGSGTQRHWSIRENELQYGSIKHEPFLQSNFVQIEPRRTVQNSHHQTEQNVLSHEQLQPQQLTGAEQNHTQSNYGAIKRRPLYDQSNQYRFKVQETQQTIGEQSKTKPRPRQSVRDISQTRGYFSEGERPVQQQRPSVPQIRPLPSYWRPEEYSSEANRLEQWYDKQEKEARQIVHLSEQTKRSFWRRNYDYQQELDSPTDLEETGDIEGSSRVYRDFCHQFYEKNKPCYYFTPDRRDNRCLEVDNFQELPRERIEALSEARRVEQIPVVDHRNHKTTNNRRVRDNSGHYMGRMGSLEDHERKVIIEFCHLLEKSKQLFNGLRELPQYGHKQWHSYFGRTFDVYTKLWKFQQQHRAVLDSKYGLKRWQIGEIASKIGQLYYHFYLRTSETAYLNEAFSFYFAIRGRSYYTKACKEDKCELMVKKLRYYARFIVVCLLLKKIKLVRELIKELDRQIVEYGNTYDPDDQIEWTVVVDEVKAFIQAEPVVSVVHPDNYSLTLSHRLSPLTTPPVERSQQMTLSLQEVLIIGSSSQQVKFSELTMDMFRMLQTLEREPTGEIQHMYDDSPRQRFNLTPSALNNKGYNLESGASRSENPHKYLLFKPSPSQILVYLASGCNDLPPNGALLLYISADGQIVPPSKHPEDVGYDIGGLITTSKTDLYRDGKDKGSMSKNKELQCFHPGDLYPFTRRPMFIIIDSDNSYVFQNIPKHFGQPLVILMSPLELPSSLHVSSSDRRQQGSLFTLFLHSPLTAFCHCCDIHTISLAHWERAQAYVDTFLTEASQIVTRSRIDAVYLNFMGDDFLRLLILRFIFCEVVLRMHRAFRMRTQLTRSSPVIPDDLIEHQALTHIVMDLAGHLQVRGNFHDPSAAASLPPKE